MSKLPLSSGEEAGAASSAQTRLHNFVDNALRSHFGYGFFVRLISVVCKIFVNVFGIDKTAVAKNNTVLILIEFRFVERNMVSVFVAFGAQQSVNEFTADYVLFDYFANVFGLNVLIEGSVRIYYDDRTFCAKTEAAGGYQTDFVGQAFFGENFYKLVVNLLTVSGRATRTSAHQYVSSLICFIVFLSADCAILKMNLLLFADSV